MDASLEQGGTINRRTLYFGVALFFTSVFMYYMIFLAGWRLVERPYRAVYAAVNTGIFRDFGKHGQVRFAPLAEVPKDADVEVSLMNRKAGVRAHVRLESRLQNYLPTTFTLSLILATRIPWRRRGIALLLGFILIQLFLSFDLWLRLRDYYSAPEGNALHVVAMYPPGGAWDIVHRVISLSPVTPYVVPVFVWLLATIRKEDFDRFLVGQTV